MFTLQTVPAAAGFSLHAGVACEAHEREKLERLCRYITRAAVSTERLSLTAQGNIRYRLKTPYRDGTTDVVFEPLDFMARLAALAPTPRVNLTRYHGVFAPNHRLREQVTPARRGRRKAQTTDEPAPARHFSSPKVNTRSPILRGQPSIQRGGGRKAGTGERSCQYSLQMGH